MSIEAVVAEVQEHASGQVREAQGTYRTLLGKLARTGELTKDERRQLTALIEENRWQERLNADVAAIRTHEGIVARIAKLGDILADEKTHAERSRDWFKVRRPAIEKEMHETDQSLNAAGRKLAARLVAAGCARADLAALLVAHPFLAGASAPQ